MSTWQERQDELDELTEKLVSLRIYTATEAFRGLTHEQCRLLLDQSHVMAQYSDILTARLDEDRRIASCEHTRQPNGRLYAICKECGHPTPADER